ncbi:MAG: DNA adenine methylase [Oscillospiraceae bacterium]|nr:DNA adenine methylase [Oscillospiraceae bacterium]
MSSAINSPFRYAGGKFYARKLIIKNIPPHTKYCEPFAGGASIFFAKEKVDSNILNDLDNTLMLVYKIIRDCPQELINFLNGIPAKKELHNYYKNEFKPKNEIDIAGRWYYLNRTSYSGIMNIQNCYWGYGEKYSMRPENWAASIKRTSEKLQYVTLTSNDFEDTIDNLEDGTFLFVDPPYFNADQDKFYTISFKREDHFRLNNVIRRNFDRLNIFLTYDNCEEIKRLYSWATEIHSAEWNYTINRTDDQKNNTSKKGERYKGKELFILNYSTDSDEFINSNEILQQVLLELAPF